MTSCTRVGLTLRSLERDGLVARTFTPTSPPRVFHALTPVGETLSVEVSSLMRWAGGIVNTWPSPGSATTGPDRHLKPRKSSGVTLGPAALAEEYGTDAVRWWLLREVPRAGDADFTLCRLADPIDSSSGGCRNNGGSDGASCRINGTDLHESVTIKISYTVSPSVSRPV